MLKLVLSALISAMFVAAPVADVQAKATAKKAGVKKAGAQRKLVTP
jgi:Ni/Co efflux regulator RcnB